jgi:hypothetical protein
MLPYHEKAFVLTTSVDNGNKTHLFVTEEAMFGMCQLWEQPVAAPL